MSERNHNPEIENKAEISAERLQFVRDALALQIEFAQHMAKVSNVSLSEALKDYTSLYKRLGIKSENDWENFAKEMGQSENPIDLAVSYYISHPRERQNDQAVEASSFAYDYDPESKVIHIHFSNEDDSGLSPLSKDRELVRLSELKEMFIQIKKQHPEAEKVEGGSWLYNLESYRRLFPPEYSNSMKEVDKGFRSMSIWGQFLGKDGKLKQDMIEEFMAKVKEAKTEEEVKDAFKFKVMEVSCDINKFYNFLGIE